MNKDIKFKVSIMPTNGIHATWKRMYDDVLACTHCGIAAPFARYRRKLGLNTRTLTNYCPNCGALMDKIEQCINCLWSDNGNKNWDSGVCLNCQTGECFENKM